MSDESNIHTNLEERKDENNIHTNLEEHKDMPLEARPEEPQHMAKSESPETEAQLQEGVKRPSSTPKAVRLATISKLLEKHTAQMERVGRWRIDYEVNQKCS